MKDNLTKLYNTMNLIETKGESTKIMAQCLAFLEGLISEVGNASKENVENPNL